MGGGRREGLYTYKAMPGAGACSCPPLSSLGAALVCAVGKVWSFLSSFEVKAVARAIHEIEVVMTGVVLQNLVPVIDCLGSATGHSN